MGIDENKVKVLQEFNDSLSEYLNIGAGIGGGFTNTNELRLMGYHEAINGPDGKKWKDEDEFELGKRYYNTPAQPGTVLMRPTEGEEVLSANNQTTLRSGVGKLMYQMQYSRPDIAQAVCDLA